MIYDFTFEIICLISCLNLYEITTIALMKIKFNNPYIQGDELKFVQEAISHGKLSGNGFFTQKCQSFLEEKYGFRKCLITHSCTGALEMIGLLINLQPGDEIIVPAYTFVSTANAFMLRGAVIKFADSKSTHPNLDEENLEHLITERTKAIVCVHYAGYSCNLEKLRELCDKHNLFLIEDAAQAIDSYYINSKSESIPVGTIGDFATFSFHDSKNIHCGEGGMLAINNVEFFEQSEIVWEKGTNRGAFLRGEIERYEWVGLGSSFLMSEISAAFLWAQLQRIEEVTLKRRELWKAYHKRLSIFPHSIKTPKVEESGNAHIFFLVFENEKLRDKLIYELEKKSIQVAAHYQSLNTSSVNFIKLQCENAQRFERTLVRLPIYYDLTESEIESICIEMSKILSSFVWDIKSF